jgi:hypothetical protein
MTEEVQRLVDERWHEYGLDAAPERDGSRKRPLRQLLRR